MPPRGPQFRLIAVVPSQPVSRARRGTISARLAKLGLDIVKGAANYPTQQPTDYVRTGDLGKGWTKKGPMPSGSDLVVEVGNNEAYTGFVMGFRSGDCKQLDKFADLGWRSIEDIGDEEIDRARPDFARVMQAR